MGKEFRCLCFPNETESTIHRTPGKGHQLVFRREAPQVAIVDSPETQQELSLVSVDFPFDLISLFFTFIVCDVCERFAYTYTCAQHEFKAPGGQRRASDALGLELQIL